MPKLPTFDQLAFEAPRPSTSVAQYRATSGAETAPGEAVARFGETASQVGHAIESESDKLWTLARQEKEKADTVRVEDAWNKYKTGALDLTNGDNGLLNTRGADAVNGNLWEKATGALASARKQLAEGLADDEQRTRFNERANITDLQTKHHVLTHLTQEQKAYATVTMQGSEAAAKAQVAANPGDDVDFMRAQNEVLQQAAVYLKGNGITDTNVVDNYKAKIVDALWVQRIDALLYSQPLVADSMFRANAGQIKDPILRLQMQAKTREAALSVNASIEAQRVIDEARANMPAPGSGESGRSTPEGGPSQGASVQTGARSSAPGAGTPMEQAQAATDRARTSGDRRRLLEDELAQAKPGTPEYRAIQAEIAQSPGGGTQQAALRADNPLAQNTSGLPNSRDIAAQLPVLLAQVETSATRLYGADATNPDRAAFVKRMTSELHGKLAAEVQQLNAIQRQAQGTLIDAVTGVRPSGVSPGVSKTGTAAPNAMITSFGQIQADPQLMRAWQLMDPQAKLGIERLIEHNLRADAQTKGDEVLFRQLFNRIHLEPGDPQKIDFYRQIIDPTIADRLSIQQIGTLRQEIDRNETPGGRSLNQLRKAADGNVATFFKTNVMFTAQPERQIAATMRWNEDAGKKIDEYVKEGKDVRSLFQLDTKDSIVNPKYLQTYVDSTPAQGLAAQAAGAGKPAQPAAAPNQFTAEQIAKLPQLPASVKTREEADAWMKAQPPEVTAIRDENGQPRWIPGRKPGQKPADKKTTVDEPGDANTRAVLRAIPLDW